MAERLVAVRLLLNPAGYTAGAAQVQRANAAMTASTTATATRATAATGAMTAGMQRTGASMAQVAGGAGLLRGGLTTPLAAAGVAVAGVTKASIDWESAWAGVTKTVEGSDAQLSALEGDLRSMAKTLPATHGEIAKVAETAGQLGVATEDVADFSRVMIDLGETTNLSAEQAATSIARLTNIMGTGQDEVDNLGSTLVDLGNNSATTEAEILTLGTRLAAAGNIAGLSEADVLAFAATLTSVGVNAEAGGTALSKTFTTIRDAVLNGGAALDTFAEVAGTTAQEFVTAFEQDPAQAIAMFIEGLGRMNAAGESTTAVFEELSLTDQRLMRALLSTAEAGDLLTDSIELSSDAWEDNVALAEEAQNRYDTTAASLSTSLNRIKDVAIDVGDSTKPVLEDLAKGFADILELGSADLLSESGLQQAGDVLRDWNVPEWLLISDAVEETADHTAEFNSEVQGLINRVPEATEAARTYRTAQLEVSDATVTAAESLANYQDLLRGATDPVFALQQRLQAVDEAQQAYNETLEDSEATQADVEDAAFAVAEAVAAAEQAALDGDLSFDAFDARLERWVRQGVITADQADDIRGRVEDLTGASEDYDGTYTGQMDVKGERRSRSEIQGLINRAERYDRNWDANLGVHGTAKARSEIQGLLNRAAAWRGTHTATFISNNIVRGSVGNLFAGRGHDGGMVTTAGIQRFHGGGEVTSTIPRFHEGSSRLAADEVPAILQTGEMVLSRAQVAMMERTRYLELVAREMVRLGDVTDDEWEQLKALGWQGKAGDRMEALYAPLDSLAAETNRAAKILGQMGDMLAGLSQNRISSVSRVLRDLGKYQELSDSEWKTLRAAGVMAGMSRSEFFEQFAGSREKRALLRAIPKAHDGASVVGVNEGLAVLQRGEEVMSGQVVSNLQRALAPMGRPMGGRQASGVMEFRHTFVAGPGGSDAFVEMANEALRKGKLNIETEAIQR